MLGTLGFCAAALAFMAYAYSSTKIAKKSPFGVQTYAWAYTVAALASIVWAAGTLAGNGSLETFVLVGDGLIMVATVLLLRTLVPAKHANLASIGAAVALAGALVWRAMDSGENPVMTDNILLFNTPRLFGAFLALVLLFVWVRSNMRFYQEVVLPAFKSDALRYTYFVPNVLAFMGISGFLFAEKSLTVVVGFTMVVMAFFALAGLNYAVVKLVHKGVSHAK